MGCRHAASQASSSPSLPAMEPSRWSPPALDMPSARFSIVWPPWKRTSSSSRRLVAGWGGGDDGAGLSPSAPAWQGRWGLDLSAAAVSCGLRPNPLNPFSTHLNPKLDKSNPIHFSSKFNPAQPDNGTNPFRPIQIKSNRQPDPLNPFAPGYAAPQEK
jgi:hypothetical protein